MAAETDAAGQSAGPDDWRGNLFLRKVPAHLLDRLEGLVTRQAHRAGEPVLVEGEPSDRICLLTAGRVGIYKGAERARLGAVEPGSGFGEMGVLSGLPRSTSVVAETDAVVWSISVDALRRFRDTSGIDLLALSLEAHAAVLGDRLASTNDVAAQWLRERMEEYRIRVSFGRLFTNVVLMLFVYTSALGILKEFSSTGSSSTITTSALLVFMALGAAWIMRTSGFPPATFGLTLERWRWVVRDSLLWSAAFCAAMTLAKAALLHFGEGYSHLRLLEPWVSPAGLGATLVAYGLYVVLSPVQELIARGLLQGSLQKMFTGAFVPMRASIVANAVFSVSHQHLGLGYALAVFIPGLFWGWLYHRHGSLLGVSISHVVIGLWGTGVLDLASVVGG